MNHNNSTNSNRVPTMKQIAARIRHFIVENFLFGNDENLTDETSFLDDGIIDSTGVLELVAYIEENFSIKIKDDELVPENLDSIGNIARFIEGKKTATQHKYVTEQIEEFSR
jgi:acyl carrier protein